MQQPRPPALPLSAEHAAARFGQPSGGSGFAAGSLLATPDGPLPVERLAVGQRIATAEGGTARVRHIARTVPQPVILVPAGSFGPGRPGRDLVLGAQQALWLGGHPLAAAALVCGAAIRPLAAPAPLYRLSVAGAGRVLAEGLACALAPPARPEHNLHAGAALARARRDQPAAARPDAMAGELAGSAALTQDDMLTGWALAEPAPSVSVLLQVLFDDVTIGFALADEPRPDLAMAGIGNGACGFAIRLPSRALAATGSGPGRLLRVQAVGSGASLPGTPLLLAGGPPDAALPERLRGTTAPDALAATLGRIVSAASDGRSRQEPEPDA